MASTSATTAREQSPYSRRRNHLRHNQESADLLLREWCSRSQIRPENTKYRRFSGSHIRTSREIVYASSFRSNITTSSTASSPGYPLKDQIDPSTYSFTNALKALQARTGFKAWECFSPDGFALNSKWNEAEKYICNPLSGEVPMECLSAKTLSGRSFFSNSSSNRITMSGPLVYSSHHHHHHHPHPRQIYTKPPSVIATLPDHDKTAVDFPIQEKKMEGSTTREIGTQSRTPERSSSSPSPASTPSIIERGLKICDLTEEADSIDCSGKSTTEIQVEADKTTGKEETIKGHNKTDRKKKKEDRRWCSMQGGCLPWIRIRQRNKPKNEEHLPS